MKAKRTRLTGAAMLACSALLFPTPRQALADEATCPEGSGHNAEFYRTIGYEVFDFSRETGPLIWSVQSDRPVAVFGTPQDDRVDASGMTFPVVVCGYGGRDTLLGGQAGDTLDGGADGDSLIGGGGDDVLYGGPDRDTLYGGAGNDSLFGGAADDRLFGEEGRNVLDGGPGLDLCEDRGLSGACQDPADQP